MLKDAAFIIAKSNLYLLKGTTQAISHHKIQRHKLVTIGPVLSKIFVQCLRKLCWHT